MKAVNCILAKRGREPITKEQYYEYIETPIKRFYDHLFDFTDITMDDIMVEYNYFYRQNIHDYPLMDGAAEVLAELDKSGVKQMILSSSSNEMIIPFAKKIGVFNYFDHILGSLDNLVLGKIERAVDFIKENRINPENCVLIGDTLHDFDTAQAIGCSCVLIPNGHQSKADLLSTGALVLDDIKLVPEFIYKGI
jgi:phosphoglycolate phosphatase